MTQSFAVAMGVVNMLTHVESLCKKIVPLLSSLDSLWKTIERQLMMHLESDNDKVSQGYIVYSCFLVFGLARTLCCEQDLQCKLF